MLVVLAVLGVLPFTLGGLMNWFMMTNPSTLLPYKLIGMITLLIWAAVAFLMKPYVKNTKQVIVGLNIVGFVVLILLGIQELLLKAYWPNFIGLWTQFYYLPLINIGAALTSWSHSVFSAYCAAFLLMVTATFLGCKLRRA